MYQANEKNLCTVLRELADYIESNESQDECLDLVNRMMNELLTRDFFGTEGQCDPRGDQRDQGWPDGFED